ncbi:MAG: hypothetical protein ABR502_06625 [Chitinophagaceae bacterium]
MPLTVLSTTAAEDLLYRLAKIIQDKFPDNKIDWSETFYEVEKNDFLEKYWKLIDEVDNSSKSPAEEVFRRFNVGQQAMLPKVNISNRVTQRLREYKVSKEQPAHNTRWLMHNYITY